jgi:hypothetical protein
MNLLSTVSPVLLLIAGFVVCFFGYRLLRFTLGLAGFCVGLALGLAVAGLITGISQAVTIIIAIVGGILGAVLASLLYRLGVFLLGAGAGALLAGIIVAATGSHHALLIRALAAIVGGILTLVLERPLVSILSAFAGGWGIVLAAFKLFGWYHPAGARQPPANYGIMIACWLVLALIGAAIQLRSGSRNKKQHQPARSS